MDEAYASRRRRHEFGIPKDLADIVNGRSETYQADTERKVAVREGPRGQRCEPRKRG